MLYALNRLWIGYTKLDRKDKGTKKRTQKGECLMSRKERKTYTEEFKQQMVQLYLTGKSRSDIAREYALTPSALDRWIKQQQSSGSFKEADNRTTEENKIIQLEKQLQQLKMENDILKQAALILGRK